MIWVFLGHAFAVYGAFCLVAAKELPAHPQPEAGA